MSTTVQTRSSTEMMESLTKLLDSKLKPINAKLEKLDAIEQSVGYALDEIKKVTDMEPRIKGIEKDISKLTKECDMLRVENLKLKECISKQESYSRRKNLKFFGFKDHFTQQNMEEQMLKFLSGFGIDLTPRDFEAVHFVGPQVKNQPRAILVRFWHPKDRTTVWATRAEMRKKGISVSEDFPDEVQQQRKLIVPTYFKAMQVCPELKPKLRGDSLILNGEVYRRRNIDKVPLEELLPRNVFTRTRQGMTAYFSEFSPLSNHYPSQFTQDGTVFHSVEQFFMYKKAAEFNDLVTADKILSTKCPVTAKQLGRHVKGFKMSAWTKVASEHMYKAMYEKFRQNDDLKDFLHKTGKTELVEASPTDTTWGVGLRLQNDAVFNHDEWRGKNLAGATLARVRQTLSMT